MSPDRLIYMANQIGTFFASQPRTDPADRIADHLAKFWDPSMRKKIVAHLEQGGEGLDPLVKDAVRQLGRKDFSNPEAS